MLKPLKFRLMKSVCGLAIHKDSVYLCILNKNREHIKKVLHNVLSDNFKLSNPHLQEMKLQLTLQNQQLPMSNNHHKQY